VAGKYRALLIGNSTYPVDEHNLQILKGPVKDIAALNRALIDSATGLFDDVDVTLLPEASSTRALRILSKFFGSADKDDVLLVYFSGHGKLDQTGRLHLCMQDTETTDLLSTAVSSTRINEFAEASRARNVVIVLDCCYAGAFRGGDFGDAVAGPGRYVLTSCRGTQLANDATVENGTSYFTQHLVDGLLGAAADRDHDGYVDFSDIYAYVDLRLREDGKQIPQRRVNGDGDLRLAKSTTRSSDVPAAMDQAATVGSNTGAPSEPGETIRTVAEPGQPADRSARRRWRGWTRRRALVVATTTAVLIAVAIVATVALLHSNGSGGRSSPGRGAYNAAAPWRLRIDGTQYGDGCTITLTDTASGTSIRLPGNLYGVARFQIPQAGTFQWQSNDDRCLVTPLPGTGNAVLPFTQEENGDTDVFAPPPQGLTVQVLDNKGGSCTLRLFDANGQELDIAAWSPGSGTMTLDPSGRPKVYVYDDNCVIRLNASA
jgi:uncharacterized caspase-like protein